MTRFASKENGRSIMGRVRVAIAGVGNCASSLIQGIEYYRDRNASEQAGLMHAHIGGRRPSDVEIVAAFDVDRRKVGHVLEDAIFATPNCTRVFQPVLPPSGVKVQMGPILDGIADHMASYEDDEAFRPADEKPVDVAHRDLISYLQRMVQGTDLHTLTTQVPATDFCPLPEHGCWYIEHMPLTCDRAGCRTWVHFFSSEDGKH